MITGGSGFDIAYLYEFTSAFISISRNYTAQTIDMRILNNQFFFFFNSFFFSILLPNSIQSIDLPLSQGIDINSNSNTQYILYEPMRVISQTKRLKCKLWRIYINDITNLNGMSIYYNCVRRI